MRYLVYPVDDSEKISGGRHPNCGRRGGEAVLQQIGIALKKNGKIITAEGIHRESLNVLAGLFFESTDYVTIENIKRFLFQQKSMARA